MQTFLPYPSFKESAKCLDMKRLGKQRVECLQILKALFGLTSGWANHPATVMWKGSEGSLVDYSLTICEEWIRRGYNDTCVNKIIALANEHIGALTGNAPKWHCTRLNSDVLTGTHPLIMAPTEISATSRRASIK